MATTTPFTVFVPITPVFSVAERLALAAVKRPATVASWLVSSSARQRPCVTSRPGSGRSATGSWTSCLPARRSSTCAACWWLPEPCRREMSR